MDGSSTRRVAFIGFAAWTIVGLVSFGRSSLQGTWEPRLGLVSQILRWFGCFYVWALFTPAVVALTRRFPFGSDRILSALGGHAAGALAFAEASALVSGLWMDVVFRAAGHRPEPWTWPVLGPAWLLQELLAYSGIVGAAHLLLFHERYRRQEAAAAEAAKQRGLLEASLKQAELDALRAQINPHFLFNTLQSVSILMQEDVNAASRMLRLLADLFRGGALRDHPLEVTLERELALVRRYLEIERIRFADRLQVRYDIPPETLEALVPSLLLQPLVENAVVHGVAEATEPVEVCIRSRRAAGELELRVSDTGPGLRASGRPRLGVGLANTKSRIERIHPGTGRLEWSEGPSGGFEVRVSIPFRRASAPAPEAA
jgi:two-component system LytT family sensor kinase